MEPTFIYYNNLIFDRNRRFKLEFTDDNLLEDVRFRKNKDYYIIIMSYYVDLTVDVTKLPQSDKIKEISDLVMVILAGSVDFDHKKCHTNNI